jgi:hypothetical protein
LVWKISIYRKECVKGRKFFTQNGLHSWYFWQHISMAFCSGNRYFNDISWAQAYNNNTVISRYYETIVQFRYLSGNQLPLQMSCKNKIVTLKNLILKYIGMENIHYLKIAIIIYKWNKFSWYNVDQGNWALYATVELY